MRSIFRSGSRRPLLFLLVLAVSVALPGALRAQQPAAQKPAPAPGEIVLSNCNVPPLVAAIQKANKTAAADTIALKAGCTYTLTSDAYDDGSGPNGLPVVTAPLTIHGNGATITRDAKAPAFRLLQAETALTLDHVTLTNGSTPSNVTQAFPPIGAGGAILAIDVGPNGALLTVTDSTVSGNAARVQGGAIHAGRVVLERDTFAQNSVTLVAQGNDARGGGAVSAGQDVRIRDSVFTGNSTASSYGGALAVGGGTITIERSTFTANAGDGPTVGNAVWFQGGDDVAIRDSTFTLNEGGGCAVNWEGGGPTESGNLTVTGSTFDRNLNGGLCVFAGPDVVVLVANSTFVSNQVNLAGEDGWSPELHLTNDTLWMSSVSNGFSPTWQGTVTLANSIVAGGDCRGPIQDRGGNVKWSTFDNTCPGVPGDPKLLPLAWNGGPTQTMGLDLGSAAIGAADPGLCELPVASWGAGGVDQRGAHRFYPCDAGAYET